MTSLTLKRFRELTAHLPEGTKLYYHAYDNGLCLGNFVEEDLWLFPKNKLPTQGVVLNPGEYYDGRRPSKKEEQTK